MTGRVRTPPNHLVPASPVFTDESLTDLAASFGTPLFVYDLDLLTEGGKRLRSYLPARSHLLYSIKANPTLGVVKRFVELDLGFEAASIGELHALTRAGGDWARAIFVGPGKRSNELSAAFAGGLGWLVIDSPTEYERCLAARPAGPVATRLAVRVNPGIRQGGGGTLRMGGRTQFGMSESAAIDLIRKSARAWPIEGIHGYLGAQILNAQSIVENTRILLDTAARIQEASGARFDFVDVGGGFGVPHYANDLDLDGDLLREGLEKVVSDYIGSHPWVQAVTFESGRFLTARAGVFLCRVIDCKTNGDEFYVVMDGGTNALGGRDTYAGARPMPLRVVSPSHGETVAATFCGPLCTPMDRVAAQVLAPRPEPGGLVALFLAGAYAYSASPGLFLSHGYCAEVGVSRGTPRLIRPRQDIKALLDSQLV